MKKKIAVIENHALASQSIRADLMKTLLLENYEVFILTGYHESFTILIEQGFKMVDVGSSVQNPFSVLIYLKKLWKALSRIEPDVCLTFTIRPGIYGNLITRFLKIPTITNVTGIGPLFSNNGLTYKIARFLYPFALKKTKRVFFQNYDDKDIFIEKKYVSKAVSARIPGSGINYKKYNPRLPKSKKENWFSFLFISRLVKDKGVCEYVEAAKILKSRHPDIEFQIVGPFWNQNMKSNTITETDVLTWQKKGIISYLGEAKDVREYISEVDCVVLPSYREGTSNVLLEAASMAKPLVATNVTGCKEIIDDEKTGFLCKVKDVSDLAAKMKKMYLLSEEDRLTMGRRGREKVIKEFDKKIVINAYIKAIKELL